MNISQGDAEHSPDGTVAQDDLLPSTIKATIISVKKSQGGSVERQTQGSLEPAINNTGRAGNTFLMPEMQSATSLKQEFKKPNMKRMPEEGTNAFKKLLLSARQRQSEQFREGALRTPGQAAGALALQPQQ